MVVPPGTAPETARADDVTQAARSRQEREGSGAGGDAGLRTAPS